MDPNECHWRVDSSFSPVLSRRRDCRYRSDGLSQETPGTPFYRSSLSSHEKGRRSGVSSDQYAYHQHSMSDEALYYLDSPSNNLQAPPFQRYDLGEFSTPTRGAMLDSSAFPQSSERQYATGVSETVSHRHFSPSPLSESSRWASSSKHSTFLPTRNFTGRHSFMSTTVYPLAFGNPVSEGESSGIAGSSSSKRKIRNDHLRNSCSWPENTFIPDLKFHQTLSDFQNVGVSSDNGANSSTREGFRWSNGSSYDLGFDADAIGITEHDNLEKPRSPNCMCGLCCRLLWQKSPWSSHSFVRSRDLPIAGVLPCGHVFHADCLEETTSKSQVQEPPCPQCLNLIVHKGCTSFSEPLQADLRVDATSDYSGSSSNQHNGDLRRSQSQLLRGSSSTRSRLMQRLLSFKGKMGRDSFGKSLFRKAGSSSSVFRDKQNQTRRL